MRTEYKKGVITGIIGTVIFVLGLIVFLSFPALYRFILDHELPLKPDSKSFNDWKDVPFPMFMNVYIFNITNPQDFLNNGTPPILEQMGPYCYKTLWTKNSIVWNSNGTVSFRENHLFQFTANCSNGTEDDFVTSLNGPLVATADFMRNAPVWKKVLLSGLFRFLGEKLFVRKKVRELLFDGYADTLISLAQIIDPKIPDMKGKFKWFYGRNATDDGLFTAYTGKGDMSKFNVITRWNGQEYLNFWKGKTCNMINGTNGEINPPLKDNQQTLSFFRTDLCRSWTLTYSEAINHYGMHTKRFIVTRDILANGTENPDNECFTLDEELPSGAYDGSSCLYGTPSVLSLPHFYLGDQSYLEAVEGLKPNKTEHEFFLDVEPISGITLGLTARLQINIHLRKIKDLRIFADLKVDSLVLPILWQEIVAKCSKDQAHDLMKKLYLPKEYVGIACYCLFAIGGLVALAAGIYIIYSWLQIKQELDDDDLLIDNEEGPNTNGHICKDSVDNADDTPILQP